MPCHGKNTKGLPCKRPCKGDWCQSHQQRGEGIWDDAKKFVKDAVVNRVKSAIIKGPRTSASTRLNSFLDKNEKHKVVKIELGRKPIVPIIHKALDKLSFGQFSKVAKKLNYSSVFHNYLLITLDDGRVIKLEKNETVIQKPAQKSDYANEIWDIPLKSKTDLTIKSMMNTAAAGNEKRFYKYRADSDNCQKFSRDMIEKNGLLPDDNPAHVQLQDGKKLIGSLPGGSYIPNLITDAASIGDRVLYGDGIGPAGIRGSSAKQALLQQYL